MSERKIYLGADELARYGRHLVLPEVGPEGQEKLKNSSVVIVGAGGLGSPAGLYLAAAGIGRIGIVDFDLVETSNLQRQVLYETGEVGLSKAGTAGRRLERINPHVDLEIHDTRLNASNAMEILSGYDVVIDGTDNFPTRYLVNDACVMLGKPNVYGSVYRFHGQASVFHASRGPCYRCLFPEPPIPEEFPNCAEGGVLGVLPGIIGTIQGTEAIKLILKRGDSLTGRLLLLDALEMRFRDIRLHRDASCPVCGDSPTIREPRDETAGCAGLERAVEEFTPESLTSVELQRRLNEGRDVLLLDVRSPAEWEICTIEGAVQVAMDDLDKWVEGQNTGREIVVYCHVGILSLLVVRKLHRRGFRNVKNLEGGIDAWSVLVDQGIPRY